MAEAAPYQPRLASVRSEFGRYPEDYVARVERTLAITGLEWHDASWHNDLCPHVTAVANGTPLLLWFSPAEDGEPAQMTLSVATDGTLWELDERKHVICDSQSWSDVLAAVARVTVTCNRVPAPTFDLATGAFSSRDQAQYAADAWVRQLIARDLTWHFDDDPAEIVDGTTGQRLFNELEALAVEVWLRMFGGYRIDLFETFYRVLREMGLFIEGRGMLSRDEALREIEG